MEVGTVTCIQCNGTGKAWQQAAYPGGRWLLGCPQCGGSGKIGVLIHHGHITKSWPYVEDHADRTTNQLEKSCNASS